MSAQYLMVGGFLGAGKTTALLRLGEWLSASGRRVGLIMNDQSSGLVDTALVRARDLPVEEIAGGCFCCRFNSLVEAAERLNESARPDVFLAEPVGSCTDLRATVSAPLQHMFGNRYAVAPLSVLLDPTRALRILGVEGGGSFSPKVLYVYRKQLEEAELLVVNKIDALDPARRLRLVHELERQFPGTPILQISARTGEGVQAWGRHVLERESARGALDIDYDRYAEGEALLGWLNCTATLAGGDVEGDELLLAIAKGIGGSLARDDIEVAHLKITLSPDEGKGIGVVNQVRSDTGPEIAFALDARLDRGELTVNLRAEAEPSHLEAAVRDVLHAEAAAHGTSLTIATLEAFRPGRPEPTYRLAAS